MSYEDICEEESRCLINYQQSLASLEKHKARFTVINDSLNDAMNQLRSCEVEINKIEKDGYKTAEEAETIIFDSTNAFMQNKMEQTKDWYENESSELRLALGKAAKKKEWYKRQEYGELMGKCILTHYSKLANGSRLKSIIDMLSSWIDK